jgi:hypothetical protein
MHQKIKRRLSPFPPPPLSPLQKKYPDSGGIRFRNNLFGSIADSEPQLNALKKDCCAFLTPGSKIEKNPDLG